MAWGEKATIHMYREGKFTEEDLELLMATVEHMQIDLHFAGMNIEEVDEEPKDQIAT
jgi:hypothetical protein